MQHDDILQAIYQVILERKANPSDRSYTASLMAKGIDKILKKVGEEAAELIIAGKGGDRREIVSASPEFRRKRCTPSCAAASGPRGWRRRNHG